MRSQLEDAFLDAVRRDVGDIGADESAAAEMDALCVEPVDGNGPSYYLRDEGTWEQMREYFVHRSIYHLKEGDPHAFVIPRLTGQAKASFVAIEYDEYGGGRGDLVHQRLFADLMDAADLDSSYLGYLDAVPAESLAVVNLMSLFGLHRELRGAAIGDFASTEITSPPGSRRMVEALRRMAAPQACIRFYSEHVEADAVHEQVVRTDVVGDWWRMSRSWTATSYSGSGHGFGRGPPRRTPDGLLDDRTVVVTQTVALTAFGFRAVRVRDDWCRTADSPCSACTRRSPP